MRENREQSFTAKQVAQATGLWEVVGNPKIRSVLDKLSASGQIAYLDKGKYRFTDHVGKTMVGEIQFTRSGAAFLLVDEGDDIFISPSSTGKAMNGDTVKVRVLQRRRRNGKQEGQVEEVLKRARTTIVGTLEEGLPGMFFLLPDDPRLSMDFRIPKETNGLKEGLKVLAEIKNWDHKIPEAEILSILGEAGEHETEMHAILLQYGFNPKFPEAVEAEAAAIRESIPPAEIEKRRDMREILTFTIDPIDAKDFDDALSIRTLENGNVEVGVHIADVSHYVQPDTELDREAIERATSVYLVDRTVPMLPEKLSNMVCSLRPNEDKLTYSAVFEMDKEAK
ncbi:MAG: RNB domain-containing ribonuclease, partial [Bacteroidota bacterium]